MSLTTVLIGPFTKWMIADGGTLVPRAPLRPLLLPSLLIGWHIALVEGRAELRKTPINDRGAHVPH